MTGLAKTIENLSRWTDGENPVDPIPALSVAELSALLTAARRVVAMEDRTASDCSTILAIGILIWLAILVVGTRISSSLGRVEHALKSLGAATVDVRLAETRTAVATESIVMSLSGIQKELRDISIDLGPSSGWRE